MGDSDTELVSRYRKGDVKALEDLVNRHRAPLFGFIAAGAPNRDQAEEIFQEVWLRAIRKIDFYRPSNFLGWLIRIARNIAIDRSRRARRCLSLDEENEMGQRRVDALPGPDTGPAKALERREAGLLVERAVARLPAEQREVFLLRVHSDMPFKEIARIQRVSINTALARMQYALAKLRPLLRPDGAEGRETA